MTEPTRRASGEPGWLTLDDGSSLSSLSFEGVTDNGGRTFDRYCAGFEITQEGDEENFEEFVLFIGPTGNAPNGVCMSGEGGLDSEEERVPWEDLPEPVQKAIENEFGLFEASRAYTR